MRNRKKIIFFILYWLIYIGLVQRYLFRHELLTLIPDILIFYVSYLTYQQKAHKKPLKNYLGNKLPLLITALFTFSIIGAVINLLNPISYLWGLRMILRYILLVWIIYQNFELSDVAKYKKTIYKAFEINLLFCILQFTQGQTQDFMGGTFTGNELLLIMTLITFILSTGDYFRKQIKPIKYYGYIAGMMMIAIFAEIKMMYFLFPVVFYGSYIFFKKFNIGHIVTLLFAFFFLIPTMQYFMSFYYNEKYVTQTFDMDFIKEETSHAYGFHEGGFNRSTAITLTNEKFLTNTTLKLLGFGLGSGSISSFFSTSFYHRYKFTSYWNFSTSYCLIEMGWIGFILYILCFVCLMSRFYAIYKKTKDPITKYWATIGIVSVGSTFILWWYNDNPYFKYLLMYFLWGICWVAIECRRKIQSSKLHNP